MTESRRTIGNRVAPARFILFVVLLVAGAAVGWAVLGWREGLMAGFDVAALVFLIACAPLLTFKPDQMREAATQNDANRAVLLGITLATTLVVLVTVASELSQKGAPKPAIVALVLATLAIAWIFSNMIYALHYGHMFYSAGEDSKDCAGLKFPDTDEPNYWDFVYFAVCLGMTFQTSDVDITDRRFRRVVTGHCLAAFVFNLGVIAFSINVLGGGGG